VRALLNVIVRVTEGESKNLSLRFLSFDLSVSGFAVAVTSLAAFVQLLSNLNDDWLFSIGEKGEKDLKEKKIYFLFCLRIIWGYQLFSRD